ncbi:beta-N-acetylhexosaminidase [Lacticaseibacillus jixiensis]|uniref:beta-N-acetylhexosaminidase n=1 Tax=Lacticaseibacillus jixiensis TaxID=3231926 RepID=UPI0036F29760
MTITWQGLPQAHAAGAAQVIALQPPIEAQVTVQISSQPTPGLRVVRTDKIGRITYHTVSDLMRALTLWLGHARTETQFDYTEASRFDTVGLMIDVARNAVLKPETCNKIFTRLASLGYTEVWLYLEDCFEVPGLPYFGRQRGRYRQVELHEMALAADAVGITLVPAIQTLAHLRNLFKWQAFEKVMDAPDCLYVQKPETTAFLRQVLQAASAPFLTKKIHIGMDEAYNLGRGQLLRDRGLIPQADLMIAHLHTVMALCEELGLKPAMWSDMWFQIASKQHRLYDPDTTFSDALVASIPAVTQVYWDYYHAQEAPYDQMFALHAKLNKPLIFASGIWSWSGLAPGQKTMQATLKAGMAAANRAKVRQVVTTMWGDDGCEAPFESAWLGIQTFVEYQYHETVSNAWAAQQFALMQRRDYQAFMHLDRFENLLAKAPNLTLDNPGKILLYEDLLLQRYAVNLQGHDLVAHYQQLAQDLAASAATPGPDQAMFKYYQHLAHTLSLKAAALQQLRLLPASGKPQVPVIKAALQALRAALLITISDFRALWHHERRGEGYEIMDLRLNGLIGRVDTTLWRLDEWLAGRDPLEELQAPALLMDKYTNGETGRGRYIQIITASAISQNM